MRLSFTMWATYDTCPSKFGFKYRQKLPDPPSPAASRGLDSHNLVERYIKRMDSNPPLGSYMVDVLDRYRNWPNGDIWAEKKIGFTIDLRECSPAEDDCAFVVVYDVVGAEKGVVDIGEWKTGKPRDHHKEQRSLYALGGLASHWMPDKVTVTTHYLDRTGWPTRLTVTQEHKEKLGDKWKERRVMLLEDRELSPKPGWHCQWCPYSRDKGGPCDVG